MVDEVEQVVEAARRLAGPQLGQHVLGRYDIYEEDGQSVGQQYPTDTGPMDILAISKDRTRLLVVELKRRRAADAVIGQIQRYMGFVHSGSIARTGTVCRRRHNRPGRRFADPPGPVHGPEYPLHEVSG
ncbi:endonuclease NucS domain-containing protein [Arthrobacter sp. NPDC056691]|uniref:endonuclease NucS domain-containing protein n=1 Tax=Arthrobacter sp. NPDC056691 TaxID=3345913 RepID=UPI003671BC7B